MRVARFAARRTWCSAIPTWCTRGSCRTIPGGRSCSRICASSSSTSCTPIAACSAVTWQTSCAVCSAICRHYGSDPVFICSSATIANPRELAEGLTGRPFELVEKNGAPRGEKFFLFVNPPVVNAQLGIRRSYLAEARRVALEFLRHNLQIILFAQSRLAVEILTTYLKDAFHGPPGLRRRHSRLSRRLPAQPPARDRARVARRAGARGRLDQRARTRDRHRRARRIGDGGISRHDCRNLAARRPRRPPHDAIGRCARGKQRTHRSVHRPQPVVFLRREVRSTRSSIQTTCTSCSTT